jgi:hypothetical protein
VIPARGYLVFVETVTGDHVCRATDPIGAVWVLARRDGSSFIDTARAEARRLYKLAGHQRAHCWLNTGVVSAIQTRRTKLAKVRHPDTDEPPVLEPYAASYRAVLARRLAAKQQRIMRGMSDHRHESPGGTGLL